MVASILLCAFQRAEVDAKTGTATVRALAGGMLWAEFQTHIRMFMQALGKAGKKGGKMRRRG